MAPLTEKRTHEIIDNWQYLLIGAQADLRHLPEHHGNRSSAAGVIQECQAKIASFQALETVEDIARRQAAHREMLRGVMTRAHAIQTHATLIWGEAEWSECLKAAWKEEQGGERFAIQKPAQIFFTRIKAKNVLQIRTALIPHPLTLNQVVFTSLKQRGLLQTQDNTFVETARITARSWDEFLGFCVPWEVKLLRRAEIQAMLASANETLVECQRQHVDYHGVEEKIHRLEEQLSLNLAQGSPLNGFSRGKNCARKLSF